MTSSPPPPPPLPPRSAPAVSAGELAAIVMGAAGGSSEFGTKVLTRMAEGRGREYSADEFAHRVELKNRHALARALHNAGLPQFKTLAQLVRVLDWALTAERTGQSLHALAGETGEPATHRYRTARGLTGHPWSDLFKQGGLTAIVTAVAAEFRKYRRLEGPSALAC